MNCDSNLITTRVLAIQPVFTDQYRSKIFTLDGIFYSEMYTFQLIEKACIRYGSTMEGRAKAVRILLNFDQKTPFLIGSFDFGVFPTISPKNPECVWIFNHRFDIKEIEKGKSRITFHNTESIVVNCSEYSLLKQQLRLHSLLDTYRSIHRQDFRAMNH